MSEKNPLRSVAGLPSGKVVFLSKNSLPFSKEKRYYWNGSLEKIIFDAKELLGLTKPVKALFDEKGKQITSIDQIERLNIVVCSTEDTIASPRQKRKIPLPTFEETIERNATEVRSVASSKKRQQTQIDPSDATNYYIAMSKMTFSEANLLSKLSLYSELSEEDKEKLDPSLNEDLASVLSSLFNQQLVELGICGFKPSYPFDENIFMWATDILQNIDIDGVNFIINGNRKTGKTHLLNALAQVTYRKMVISGINESYLVFPINFALLELIIDNELSLYYEFCKIAVRSLKYSCIRSLTVLDSIYDWMISLPSSSTPHSPPPHLKHIYGSNMDKAYEFAQLVCSSFYPKQKESRRSEKSFYSFLIQIPYAVCRIFGMKSPFFVIDHIDLCGAYLSSSISTIVKNTPFLFATHSDSVFSSIFQIETTTPLFTDGSISYFDTRTISLPEAGIIIDIEDCMGCPGIVGLFIECCDTLEMAIKFKPKAGIVKDIVATGSLSLDLVSQQIVLGLLQQLMESKCPKVDSSVLNMFAESPFVKIQLNQSKLEKKK